MKKNQQDQYLFLIKQELKTILDKMNQKGIIAPISVPTHWVSSLVIVKKNNKMKHMN